VCGARGVRVRGIRSSTGMVRCAGSARAAVLAVVLAALAFVHGVDGACPGHTFSRQCAAFANQDPALSFTLQTTRGACKTVCEAFLANANAGIGCCQYAKVCPRCPSMHPTTLRNVVFFFLFCTFCLFGGGRVASGDA
jgi:hypothetical protein